MDAGALGHARECKGGCSPTHTHHTHIHTAWLAGAPVFCNTHEHSVAGWGTGVLRLLLHTNWSVVCAFRNGVSLMPGEFMNMSLPPWTRADPKNMFLSMLIPSTLSATAQRKYFEHICLVDFNPAATRGVMGPHGPCKVIIVGISLDLKGREKFQDQKSVQSFNGCSTCCVVYESGAHRGLVFSVARRFLPHDHKLRRERAGPFEYTAREDRPPPGAKSTSYVIGCAMYAMAHELEHFLGQKGLPMFASLVRYNYPRTNIADWMHNLGRVFVSIVTTTVGGEGDGWVSDHYTKDAAHRQECQTLGIFESVWTDKPTYLPERHARLLGSLDLDAVGRQASPWLKRWLRRCGCKYTKHTTLRELRAAVSDLVRRAAKSERIVVSVGQRPLPWRLSKRVLGIIDQRVVNIVYPRYSPVCSNTEQSFWKNPSRAWRTADKIHAFLVIMPTSMRGCGLPIRVAIRRLVHGLRILEGQSLSEQRALALRIEPGSRPLAKASVERARLLIAEGLSYLHGCVPPSTIPPASHCLLHYADAAGSHGVLKWYWLMAFERFNKLVKNSVKNKHHPMASVASTHLRDASARRAEWADGSLRYTSPKCRCTGVGRAWSPDGALLAELILAIRCGCCAIEALQYRVMAYRTANVLGTRFTAAEPLTGVRRPQYQNRRCGSVITAVIYGRSQYGFVEHFITCSCAKVPRVHYAIVKWFAAPEYPDGDPLLVRVDMEATPADHLPRLLPLARIDPSRILTERDGRFLFMVLAWCPSCLCTHFGAIP